MGNWHRLVAFGLVVTVASVVELFGCAAIHSSPAVSEEPLKAWGSTQTLTNGEVAVQVSPAIGRVMYFSAVGEPNLLWNNPTPKPSWETPWPNYGGDKLWPWPQRPLWSWPPPRGFDPGPFKLQHVDNGYQMVGPVDPSTGLQASREVRLTHAQLENIYTITRSTNPTTQSASPAVACWAVTQVHPGDEILVRLDQRSTRAQVNRFDDSVIETVPVSKRWLRVRRPLSSGKISVAGDALAMRSGNRVLLIERIGDGTSQDVNPTSAQVYFYIHNVQSEPIMNYCELELIGSESDLQVGECVVLRTTWKILSYDQFLKTLNL